MTELFFESLQVVYNDSMINFEEISKLNVGSAVIIKGTLIKTPQAKQPFEVQAEEIIIEGASSPDYPLQKKRHGFEYLRTISHLRPRTNTFQAVFRVRSLLAFAIHKFFNDMNFVYVHTPIITGSDCEFYLDLRRYGSARHSGFGLGFERMVMYLTGMTNIRDVVPFPRTVNNYEL